MQYLVGLVIVIGLVAFAFGADAARAIVRVVLGLAAVAVLAFVAYVVWDVADIGAWLEAHRMVRSFCVRHAAACAEWQELGTIAYFTAHPKDIVPFVGLLAMPALLIAAWQEHKDAVVCKNARKRSEDNTR
jgi:hypothetical protein